MGITSLRKNSTILQSADQSPIKPDGIIEDVVILVESWEYLVDFTVLQTKSNLGGYPLILGQPWLATTYAYIVYRSGNMHISHGNVVKELTLYPPAKPMIQQEIPLWLDEEEVEQEDETLQLYLIEQSLAAKPQTKDDFLSQFINSSPSINFVELFSSICTTQKIDNIPS